MSENNGIADLVGEVRLWATNGEHRSFKSRSRARLRANKLRARIAAEILAESDLPSDDLAWLLVRRTLLTELGRSGDALVEIARVLVRLKPDVRAGCRLIRRLSGRSGAY